MSAEEGSASGMRSCIPRTDIFHDHHGGKFGSVRDVSADNGVGVGRWDVETAHAHAQTGHYD